MMSITTYYRRHCFSINLAWKLAFPKRPSTPSLLRFLTYAALQEHHGSTSFYCSLYQNYARTFCLFPSSTTSPRQSWIRCHDSRRKGTIFCWTLDVHRRIMDRVAMVTIALLTNRPFPTGISSTSFATFHTTLVAAQFSQLSIRISFTSRFLSIRRAFPRRL